MAEGKITKDDLYEEDVYKDLRESAAATLVLIEKVNDSFIRVAQTLKQEIKVNPLKSLGDINKMSEHVDKATKLYEQSTKAKEQEKIATDQLLKGYEGLTQAQKAQQIELAKMKIGKQDITAQAKQEALAISEAVDAYKKLDNEYVIAQRLAKNMGATFGENSKQFKQAAADANVLRERIDKIDQGLNQFHRNVGNYKSGFSGLGNAVNQVTREMPAFINSAQTGFMAISNNLPILIDQIKQVRTEQAALRAEGKESVSTLKALGSAVFSMGTFFSLLITALTLLGPKLVDWIFGTEKATEAQTKFNEQLKKTNDILRGLAENLEDSRIRMQESLGVIDKAEADRLRLRNNFNKEYAKLQKEFNDQIKQGDEEYRKAHENDTKLDLAALNKNTSERLGLINNRDLALKILAEKFNLDMITINSEEAKSKLKSKEGKAPKTAKEKEEELFDFAKFRKEAYDKELSDADNFHLQQRTRNEYAYLQNEISKEKHEENIVAIETAYLQERLRILQKFKEDTAKIENEIAKNKVENRTREQKKAQAEVDKISEANYRITENREKLEAEQKKKEDQARADRIEKEQAAANAIQKVFDDLYNRKIELAEREIQSSKDKQQTLALLAQRGVEDAQNNLAFEQKKQAELEEKKLKAERNKQKTEFAIGLYKAYAANDGDLGKTLKDSAALLAAISALPTFFEGTGSGTVADALGKPHLPGRDGYIIRADGKEKVFNEQDSSLIPHGMSNHDVALAAQQQARMATPVLLIAPSNSNDLEKVTKQLEEVNHNLKNMDYPKYSQNFNEQTKFFTETFETRGRILNRHHKSGGPWGDRQ